MHSRHRDVIAQINLNALCHNVAVLRQQCRNGVALCAALKANAYGHGVKVVAPALDRAGVDMAAVATLAEAIDLREIGWAKPILLFGPIFADGDPSGRTARLRAAVDLDLTVTVVDYYGARDLAAEAQRRGKVARCHIKVDTGLSRMGISPKAAVHLADRLRHLPCLRIDGLYMHFATASEADNSFCQHQLRVFKRALADLRAAGLRPRVVHAAATAALLDLPEAHFDMVRPGIGLYGLLPSQYVRNRPALRPVLKVTSRLVLVKRIAAGPTVGYGRTWQAKRDSILGIVPIGYHDGYLRCLSNKAVMMVRHKHVPVVGRISMDQTVVDLTDVPEARVGDEVVVIDDNPDQPNSVPNLARLMQTVPYEVMALLGNRVARVACRDSTATCQEPLGLSRQVVSDGTHANIALRTFRSVL